jgi:hypothetical protein
MSRATNNASTANKLLKEDPSDGNYRNGGPKSIGTKKLSHQRDLSLRVKSINETDKLNNSINEF